MGAALKRLTPEVWQVNEDRPKRRFYQAHLVEGPEPKLPKPRAGGSLGLKALTREEKRFRDELYWLPVVYDRPEAGCENVPRPCPFVSCKHNNYLDRTSSGAVKLNFPDLEPHEIDPKRSCAIDVAMRGGASLAETGRAIGLTQARVQQIEAAALEKIRGSALGVEIADLMESERRKRKRDF